MPARFALPIMLILLVVLAVLGGIEFALLIAAVLVGGFGAVWLALSYAERKRL